MWNIFQLALNLVWLGDILNLKGFEMLDTTYPVNTLWWIAIWVIVGGINNSKNN